MSGLHIRPQPHPGLPGTLASLAPSAGAPWPGGRFQRKSISQQGLGQCVEGAQGSGLSHPALVCPGGRWAELSSVEIDPELGVGAVSSGRADVWSEDLETGAQQSPH